MAVRSSVPSANDAPNETDNTASAQFIPNSPVEVFSQNSEEAQFLDQWVASQRGIEPEALGAFQYFAKSNGWFADTPSGWQFKFSRWSQHGLWATM